MTLTCEHVVGSVTSVVNTVFINGRTQKYYKDAASSKYGFSLSCPKCDIAIVFPTAAEGYVLNVINGLKAPVRLRRWWTDLEGPLFEKIEFL